MGYCLMDALDDLSQEVTLTTPVIKTIISQFEKSLGAALENVPHVIDIRGSVCTFQFVNDVWKLGSTQLKGRVGNAEVNATNTVVVLSVTK